MGWRYSVDRVELNSCAGIVLGMLIGVFDVKKKIKKKLLQIDLFDEQSKGLPDWYGRLATLGHLLVSGGKPRTKGSRRWRGKV